ncbi:MAG: serine/threonine protein kinase [Proteobacteria bacterium]|nr:serine/threonine protein kinase [Cystobacterineae bacterium]MCL2259056.1 serine/threonine protein kinase [Cystobacterineae bacterium]MCL2314594.1 serine/threonine protein kinase [Pseudomonadota bacterium]
MSKARPEPDVFRGRRVGRYEVLTRLNIGGMAELFLAFTTGPGGFRKFVVIKQILPDIASDEAFVRMFLDEARITAALNHPNVGQVYELGEEGGQFYLAMEYIAGQNLEHIIRRAARRGVPLPIGFSVKVMRDVCLALNYAHNFADLSTGHSAKIIHRDISPKNIMVTYAGTVKVVDFGIAKARNRLIRTRVGMVKGTSGYMSPEQVRNGAIDGRTDLFASAVILHELLTGQRLFWANTDLVMMKKIAEGEIPHPRKLNPALSTALAATVMKGLERNLRERFQNGAEMARALEKAYPNIADEGKTASFMSELFPDKMNQTQALLESAGMGDSQEFYKVVWALGGETGEASPRRSLVSQNSSGQGRMVSSPKLPNLGASSPVVVPNPTKSERLLPPRKPSSASLAAPKQPADNFKGKVPIPKKRAAKASSVKLSFVKPSPAKPSPVKPSPGKRKRWLAWRVVFGLLVVVVVASWVFLGPLRSQVRPYAAKTVHWVKRHVFQEKPAVELLPSTNPREGLSE